MYIIGLTGGIACGKSTVSRALAERGIPVVDADVVSRELVVPGAPLLSELTDVFGDGILCADGTLDRARLGRIVFSDRDMLERLNGIMHPAIWKECLRQLGELRPDHKTAVLVAPLLYEHGGEALVDTVWVVACTPEEQLRRLLERDHLSEEQARGRLRAQMPVERKVERADHVIANDGSLADLEKEIAVCLEMIEELSLRDPA